MQPPDLFFSYCLHYLLHQQISCFTNLQNLVTFTEEIRNGKLHFLCSEGLSLRLHPLCCFLLISNEICWGIKLITINYCNRKKLVKLLKLLFLGPTYTKNGFSMDHYKFAKTFYFIKTSKVFSELSFTVLYNVFC